MGPERKSLRVGAAVILGAVILRLLGNLLPQMGQISPVLVSWLLYGETGRWPQATATVEATRTTEVWQETGEATEPAAKACFSASDAQGIRLHQTGTVGLDTQALLEKPLEWSLRGEAPKVLILHTHACESYADSGGYRTEDTAQNMVSIGEAVAEELEKRGIGVIHDRTLHDRLSYDGSYDASRQTVTRWLAEYPEICLVLDLHRDAIEDKNGNQLGATVEVNDLRAAQLMLVLGTGYAWQENPQWQENVALGLKLYVQLERQVPGICRPFCLRTSRYNQDLSPGMLLLEVGTAGNTHAEAVTSAGILAEAIAALANGTE